MQVPAQAALTAAVEALRPAVDAHVTPERVRRYLSRLCDTPAPSTAASAFRTPVLKALLREDGALGMAGLHLREDFENTGSTVLITGTPEAAKKLWYFAHLDTISYLVQPRLGDGYPLVPFCYHLMKDGVRPARAYRFDLAANRLRAGAGGRALLEGRPPVVPPEHGAARTSAPATGSCRSRPIGRIRRAAPSSATWTMRAASPRSRSPRRSSRRLAIEALIALPDEEEGPPGAGNQMMGRGGSRIVSLLAAAGPRRHRRRAAGRRRPGRRYACRRREFDPARSRRGARRVLQPGARRRDPAASLCAGAAAARRRGPGGRARAGVQQRLHLAQRRRQRAPEDAQHPAARLPRLQPALRPRPAARQPPRRRRISPRRSSIARRWCPSTATCGPRLLGADA